MSRTDDMAEATRRQGLMHRIVEGLPMCVEQEHMQLYRLVRTKQPDAPFSANGNGVFVPLKHLSTPVLVDCYRLIQHGIAQEDKEHHRMEQQIEMLRSLGT